MDTFFTIIIFIALAVVILLLGVAFVRNSNLNYRTGKGLFENSEYNLEDKKDISDKEYYDGDGGHFK
ncbi:MAG: hypothetical protein IIZ07_05750 [Ruminococcus sp.]|nr:hypothetical protein [Ruminococcus sp.]